MKKKKEQTQEPAATSTSPLAYRDEEDRAYGLAGMAITIASLDAIDHVAKITLDTDGPMVVFSNDFFYAGSQSVSPKATWNKLLENYRLTAAMVVSNILSRRYVHERTTNIDDMLSPLREILAQEGRETCELEQDEIDNIFSRVLNYSQRIFANRRLFPLIDEFAGIIARRRSLTGREIAEELAFLRMI